MEQYHEQQGQISDTDLEKLNSEFAEWQKRMESRMDHSQAHIQELQAKIEASRKVKSQLDKVDRIIIIHTSELSEQNANFEANNGG